MAENMQGMFGEDPALLQQAILQQEQDRYAQAGRGSLDDAIGAGAAAGGGMLGKGIGSMMGYQDPRMQDAQMMQQMQMKTLEDAKAAGIDPSNPMEYGKLLANNFMAIGKPKQAYDVIQQMQSMDKSKSEAEKNRAAAIKDNYIPNGENGVFGISQGKYVGEGGNGLIGGKITNQYGAIDFLTKVKEAVDRGEQVPQTVLDKAKGIYSYITRPQISADGSVIQPGDYSHLDPSMRPAGGGLVDPNMPDAALASYGNMLASKGVPPDKIDAILQQLKTSGKPVPTTQEANGSYKVGESTITPDPIKMKREQFNQATTIEQRFKDDYTKAVEKPQLVLDAADQVRNLVKDKNNPTALNAAATIGQHLIEPTNQALKNEIDRLMGGGNVLEQVKGLVSQVVSGTASPQQIDWFVRYANDMRQTALNSYKGIVKEQYNNLSKYSDGNPEIKASRVVTTERLARYEGVPYASTPAEVAKLPPGTEYYSAQDVNKRITPKKGN